MPPFGYFLVSAVFHYLGPAFAVLLFARVDALGVALLRIGSAAVVFALWRRPWRVWRRCGPATRRLVIAWAAVFALMNSCFYLAIERLPLGTVAAIEFLPVIAIAAAGTRTRRNAAALVLALAGVALVTQVRLEGSPLGVALAIGNALLFACYLMLGHRIAQAAEGVSGVDSLAVAMPIALLFALPLGVWGAAPAFTDPVALAAGVGVGISSSVIPYVCDQLAMARLPRATYALLVSLLPAMATVIGVVVLAQLPRPTDLVGVALVVAGVALHRQHSVPPRQVKEGPLLNVFRGTRVPS